MGVKVIQVKCPKCGQPIKSKQKDLVFYCDCGTIHIRDGAPKTLDYEIAEFGKQYQGDKIYMPFWRIYATVNILSEQVQGGFISRLSSFISGDTKTGNIFIFVPAIWLLPDKFKYWATMLTNNPPRYNTALRFDHTPRIPCNISEAEAVELGDFIVLSNEAEKPGVLQNIKYELKVNHVKLVYLPFYFYNNDYYIGL